MFGLTKIYALLLCLGRGLLRLAKVGAVVRLFNGLGCLTSFEGVRSGLYIGQGCYAPLSGRVTRLRCLAGGGVWAALLILTLPALSLGVTPPGTIISNTATVTHDVSVTRFSNTIQTTVSVTRTSSAIELFSYDVAGANVYVATTGYSTDGTLVSIAPLPDPVTLLGAPIAVNTTVPIVTTASYLPGEPLFVRLTDTDQDLDFGLSETVFLTLTVSGSSEEEIIELTETGVNTGVFTGFIQTSGNPSTLYDGTLDVTTGSTITATYVDIADGADTATDIALVTSLNPAASSLYVLKSTSTKVASIGDTIGYEVTIENLTAGVVTGVLATDTLPLGFRYAERSVRYDGLAGTGPQTSSDATTLTFTIASINPGQVVTITYAVVLGAGAIRGDATNTVSAASGALGSNTATAIVRVEDAFFTSRNIIAGSVLSDNCGKGLHTEGAEGTDGAEAIEGIEGVRIFLEDGTFVVTDSRGMYHFEGLKPRTHVVAIDEETIPDDYLLDSCQLNNRFAGKENSQFVDLMPGTLWRADFHLKPRPKKKGALVSELRSAVDENTIRYAIPFEVTGLALGNVRLTVILPEGVTFTESTATLNKAHIEDPAIIETALNFALGDFAKDSSGEVNFEASVKLAGERESQPTKALFTFNTPEEKNLRTMLMEVVFERDFIEDDTRKKEVILRPQFEVLGAELHAVNKKLLNKWIDEFSNAGIVSVIAVGHTDNDRISKKNRDKFKDNYALSRARAEAVGAYLVDGLGVSRDKLGIRGLGPDRPVASNDTPEGKALNRRVELQFILENIKKFYYLDNTKGESGPVTTETFGQRERAKDSGPGTAGTPDIINVYEERPEDDFDYYNTFKVADLDLTLTPALGWLWPTETHHPPIPTVNIAVSHGGLSTLKLFVDGAEASPLTLESRSTNAERTLSITRWRSVPLKDGTNLLEVVEVGPDGLTTGAIRREVHYSGPPVKVEFIKETSRLVADGKNPPIIAVRLTDRYGHPARRGLKGEFRIEPPYMSLDRARAIEDSPMTGVKDETATFEVGQDGMALLEVKPTVSSGELRANILLSGGPEEVRAWLSPHMREWILVGIAEGTTAYNTLKGNIDYADYSGMEDDLFVDGRVALYAKGRVKGEWLLTMSYDSEKNRLSHYDRLHSTIDPDEYYTVYGDSTTQGYDAMSSRKLYVKMEKENFYALFGDYNTGMTMTELSRYTRSFNGLKTEYHGERLKVTAFATETSQAFIKDELRGNGTSGLYELTRSDILINSEKISIETRDRFNSERVIKTRTLARYIDYTIDYDNGTVFFKEAVLSRDSELNHIYIVVDYESNDTHDKSMNYGGRASMDFLVDNALTVGASLIHEESVGRDGDLYGADVRFKLDDSTEIRAEVSHTNTDKSGVTEKGDAYLIEATRRGPRLKGRAYVLNQDSDFGLGQQMATEGGKRKLGVEGELTTETGLMKYSTHIYRQFNLKTDAQRDFAEVRAAYTEASRRYSFYGGLQGAEDRFADSTELDSIQVSLGGRLRLLDNRLTLGIDNMLSIGPDENADYPTRTVLLLEHRLSEKLSVFATQEFTRGTNETSDTTLAGFKTSPWANGELTASIGEEFTENGHRVFSSYGLSQALQLTERLTIDASLDRSNTIEHDGNIPFDSGTPTASGGDDFTAVSLGLGYRHDRWSTTSRFEVLNSKSMDKTTVFAGINGEVREGLSMALGVRAFHSESAADDKETNDIDLDLSLARRPLGGTLLVLNRLDLNYSDQWSPGFRFTNYRIVENMDLNWMAGPRTQLAFKLGLKYVDDTIGVEGGGDDYEGFTDVLGIEGRYDLTRKVDIGLRGMVLHSWELDEEKYLGGVSAGYNLMDNVWISLGYNFSGFRDSDFSKANYTYEGAYMKFRIKFDSSDARAAVKWLSGQE